MAGEDRTQELKELMEQRILVLDGATGTMLQSRDLTAEDFGGEDLEGCNENLVRTRPDVISDVHRQYMAAGADIIETNTFGGTSVVLEEYDLHNEAVELNRLAAELARKAADAMSTAARPRFVAGSMGPTTKAITVTGGISFDGLRQSFYDEARGLLMGGVDLFLVETCQDTRNTKAALIAVEQACREHGVTRPIMVSGTIEPMGTMLAGQTAEAFVASLDHLELLSIGLNCATGPEAMTDHLRSVHQMASCAVSCYPNAGLPNEDGEYEETPERLATALERFIDQGWLNMVGGCCGTTDAHIRAIAAMADGKRPRKRPASGGQRFWFTGIDLVEAAPESRPLLVGERTNVIGSAKFRRLVAEERWDEAAEVGRRQVEGGAQIVDVCLQSTERDELEDVDQFYPRLIRSVKAPIMIDTTDPEAVELALTYCQGKAIVNSINLEDGEEKFEIVSPLLRRYGAAVVVGAIDEDPEQAQAFSRERKLAVAKRSVDLLVEKYGIPERDIVIDPLVFPVGSGDAAYVGGAVETIEGLAAIKAELPGCLTILGISNVSFGLPTSAREVLNSVFLYLCTKAGLDLAIVNSERLERYASISDEERDLAEDLLLNRPPAEPPQELAELLAGAPDDWREQSPEQRLAINRLHVERVAAHFRGRVRETMAAEELTLDERLRRYVVDGTREGLLDDLQSKLDEGAEPLKVINGPLMDGMAEVGRLFNANELIVAEVLRSAESMKAAVSFLEQHMESDAVISRGKVMLATVKGDVHDIGKNLVGIILGNNGFDVVDLGIKVTPQTLITAIREQRPDIVGLSGLLVKSALHMVSTAEDLRTAGIDMPILVGGAALSGSFVRNRIQPVYSSPVVYCADAMKGLEAMVNLTDDELREAFLAEQAKKAAEATVARKRPPKEASAAKLTPIRRDLPLLDLPSKERDIVNCMDRLDDIWAHVNPQMLYGKHLGLKGIFNKMLAGGDPKAVELERLISGLKEEARAWMKVVGIKRFFEAEASGESVSLYLPGAASPRHTFVFPRQDGGGRCLADYILPPRGGQRDTVALFVVGAGEGVRERSALERANGELLRSHAIQALAIETAEAAAEWLHREIRREWGFPDGEEMTMKDRFAARYRGKRYSPGYPAWPELDDQAGIWQLLSPEDIGIQLTESMMMDPEASVSAIAIHHPDARYFGT